MTQEHDESSHPAPHRDRVDTHESLFAVYGAPLAWIVDLTASFAFASTPCFDLGHRVVGARSSPVAPLVVGVLCLAVALGALWLSVLLLRRTNEETGGGKRHLLETGQGRTRFLALWGIAFSPVFALLIAVNIAALLGLPICAL